MLMVRGDRFRLRAGGWLSKQFGLQANVNQHREWGEIDVGK
jgi:hypothetical protein